MLLILPALRGQVWTGATSTTWSTTTNWSTGVVPGAAATATFSNNTARDPNLTGVATVGKLLFNSGSDAETFTGSTLTLNGISGVGIDNQSGVTQTFNNTLAVGAAQTWTASSGDLTFSAVTLSANLTLTGSTTFTFGGTLTNSGGSRTLTNNTTGTVALGAVNLSNNNTARTLTFSGTGDTTVSGVIGNGGTGAGVVTKTGAGTLTLSGTNTYTGATNVTVGVLNIQNSSALGGTASGTTVSSGAALEMQGGIAVGAETLSLSGTGISSTGALRNISGSNSWSGAVTLAANTTIGSDAGSLTLSGGISGNTRTLTVVGAGDTTLSGAITTTTGGLVMSGAGNLTLSGASANTYTGTTVINDGTVNLNKTAGVNALGTGAITVGDGSGLASSANLVFLASNQLANTAAITLNSDGRLALNDFTESINTIGGTGLIDLATSGYLTVGASNGSSSFSGSISGTGTLEKTGTGTLTFNSTISYAGSLTLSGGILQLNGVDLTVDTLTLTGNSTIDFAGSSATLNLTNLNLNGFTLNITNWANAADYFYAASWTGAVTDTRGAAPMNLVTFNGFTSADTQWQGYDSQVTPVPEPGSYGAVLVGALAAFFGWRRRRG